jgi:hypothetical protein
MSKLALRAKMLPGLGRFEMDELARLGLVWVLPGGQRPQVRRIARSS